MPIDKIQLMYSLVEHGKNIEKLRRLAEELENKRSRIKEDCLLVEDIVSDFQRIVNSLTQKEASGRQPQYFINQFYLYLLQSIVSTNVEMDKMGDLLRWLITNKIDDARGFLFCLAEMLDEPCGLLIYKILFGSEEYMLEEVALQLESEKENVKKRQRGQCLDRKILDEYLKQFPADR